MLNWGGEHKGNGNKLVFTRKAIETLDVCDVLIFSDAFDVLYVPNLQVPTYPSCPDLQLPWRSCGC